MLRCEAALQRKGVYQSWSRRAGQKAPLRACLPCALTGGSKELLFPWLAAVRTCGFRAVVPGHPHPCVQSLKAPTAAVVLWARGRILEVFLTEWNGCHLSFFLDPCEGEDTLLPPAEQPKRCLRGWELGARFGSLF